MERLPDTTADELRQALDSLEDTKPAKRLMAAVAYKNGITQSELAEWFDVERKTIYNWLARFEERDLESAVRDEQRPGRPRKLSPEQLEVLEALLRNPPTETGVDAPAWTTGLLRQFIRDQYDVDYSRPSCRRLMKEAGLRSRTPRRAAAEIESNGREELEEELRNLGHVWLPR